MELIDVLDNVTARTIRCLNRGFVTLLDAMPRLIPDGKGTADHAVAEAARVSFGKFDPSKDDTGLIRYLMRNRHCYDAGTEVLTADGWKMWPDVTNSDVLGIYDPAQNTLCYERPEYLTKDRYVGEMYRVSHGGVDLLVTPDHSMYVKKKRWCGAKRNMVWEDGYSLVPAKDLEHSSMVRYSKVAPFIAGDSIDFRQSQFPGSVRDADALLKLMGFFVGDGYISHTSANQISFHLKKERKRKYLRELAMRLGWAMSDGGVMSVNCRGISAYFRENFYDADGGKKIPPFLYMLNAGDATALLDGLRNSDGSEKRSTWVYSTSVAEVADAVQLVALHAGLAAHRSVNCTGMWTVAMLARGSHPVVNQSGINTSWEQYDGYVYCAKTRTGVLVVRRNGKIVLSGNTSPFEMVSFKFHCRVPIFVARQWMRHRTGSFNEISGRYTEFKDDYYEVTAGQVRRQSRDNKQGGTEPLGGDAAAEFAARSRMGPMLCHEHYGVHVREGVAKEQARMLLPMSLFTEFVWRVDLHNLLHFLDLRCDSHAQQEIREYGEALLKLITPIVPACVSAWQDYSPFRDGLLLSRAEVECVRRLLAGKSAEKIEGLGDTEQLEWQAKATRLGLTGGE